MNVEKFVVVAGSGISKASPSNLPSWWEYNLILLEELNRSASSLLPEGEYALTLNLMEYIPVVSVSDFLTRGAMGKGYFPILKILDGSSPNNIHYGLASLAQRGQLKAIITTNFDTLLEQAFDNSGVPYQLLINEKDYFSSQDSTKCLIIKIHGSVTDEESLIDTVTQKMIGLPLFKKQQLNQLFQMYPVYVIGYSGEDFRFGQDYLPIDTALNSFGVNWIIHPGSSPSKYIDAFKGKSSFVLQELTLESWLEILKIRPYLSSTTTSTDESMFADKARVVVKNALSGPGMGPYVNLGLAISLLYYHGNISQALSLSEKALSIITDKSYRLDHAMELIGLLTNAGLVFLYTQHYEKAENAFLLEKSLILQSYKYLLDSPIDTAVIIEYLTNLGTAIVNLGKVYISRNEDDDNEKAIKEYYDYIQLCSKVSENIRTDNRVLNVFAIISFNLQQLRYNYTSDYDLYIHELKTIILSLKKVGNAESSIEVLIELAKAYMQIGEYDSSEKYLSELMSYLGVAKRKSAHHIYLLLLMELKIRRHQDCHSDFNELIKKLSGEEDVYRNTVIMKAFEVLQGAKDYQDIAIECLKQVQNDDLSSDLAEAYKRHCQTIDRDSEFPYIITHRIQQTIDTESKYEKYRTLIIINEYLNNYEKLNELWNVLHTFADKAFSDREKDFNFGFYKTVLRHDHGILRLEARNRYVADLINEEKYETAITLCNEIIESDHIDSPEYSIIKGCAYGSKSLIEFIQNDLETSINDYHRAYTLLSANEASKLDLKTLIYNRAIMLMKRGDGKEASSILADWIDLYGDDEDILTLKASLM